MASMSSGDESLRLCVFDLRRGQTEGQELDKILFFHPPELDVSTQLSVTGLSEGLITFTRSASTYSLLDLFRISWYESVWILWVWMQTFLPGGSLWGYRSRKAFSCFLWGWTWYLDGDGKTLFYLWMSDSSNVVFSQWTKSDLETLTGCGEK